MLLRFAAAYCVALGGLPECAWTQTLPQNHWKVSPNIGDPYAPLSLKDKGWLFGDRVVEPTGWAKSAFTAGIAQWRDSPEEWEQGMKGYGRRYGHRILSRGVEAGIGFGVAALLRQDARYFRKPGGSVGSRIGNALSQIVVTRRDGGGKTFPAWRVSGNFGGQFVTNAWRPERQTGVGNTLLRGTISTGFDAASNVFKEFWPDIRRRIFKR